MRRVESRIIERSASCCLTSFPAFPYLCGPFLDSNLHSPQRRLIELRIEHADLDALIDRISHEPEIDELMMRRLKKRRLALRDDIARVERELSPDEPA